MWIIDVVIHGDIKIEEKELEKINRYRDLAIELTQLWTKHTKMILIVIGALGATSKSFMNYFKLLELTDINH